MNGPSQFTRVRACCVPGLGDLRVTGSSPTQTKKEQCGVAAPSVISSTLCVCVWDLGLK